MSATGDELVRLPGGDGLEEVVVTHENGAGAATGEAFDEFEAELMVRGGLDAVGVGIEAELVAQVTMEGVRTGKGTAQGAADPEMKPAGGLLAEHRVEGDEFEDLDRLEVKPGGGPFDRLGGEASEVILDGVEDHDGSAAFDRVMTDHIVDFGEG